jgi:hypothetical protein
VPHLRISRSCAAVAVVCLAGVVSPASAHPRASSAAVRCGNVLVQFSGEGRGGATGIRASRISCRGARKVAKNCIRGRLRGWNVTRTNRQDPSNGSRILKLTSGRRTVWFALVGGGPSC